MKSIHNHIFIVEDDLRVAELLQVCLERFGYQVTSAHDFRDIASEIRESGADVILLDINLPFYDGFYWCRMIRQFTKAPIIFISARESEMDQVFAIENGGDDFIQKPFHPDIVLAKVKALIRRTYGEYADDMNQGLRTDDERITIGPLTLDVRRAQISCDGKTESLSKTELQLIRRLLEANGGVVERNTLLEALWDDTEFVDDNTLTVNVTRLRRKIGMLCQTDFITTVRGLGYKFDVQAAEDLREYRGDSPR